MNKGFSPTNLPGRAIAPWCDKAGREVLMIEALPVSAGDVARLRFERQTQARPQGVWLGTVGNLRVLDREGSQFELWYAPDAPIIHIEVVETDGLLRFYNIFEHPPGSGLERSQMNGSGMLPDVVQDGWIRYSCNDFGLDTEFDKLVFSIWIPAATAREQTAGRQKSSPR